MRLARLAPPALWLAGMLMAFYPVLFSGFARVPGDRGDARLTNYLLEHNYRWLWRHPPHLDLWSPPFFHPEPNVAAYSDVLLAAGPFYWPWRALGLAPEDAFQLCLVLLVSLNYLAFYLLGRRGLGLPPLAAALGAFLFAFASPRATHLGHFQLQVHVYTVACVYALVCLLGPGRGRGGWVLVFFAALAAQFYGSFYLGWFLGLALAVALAWALGVRDYRRRLGELIREHGPVLCLGGLLAGLALGHLGWHYLRAARLAGYHDDAMIQWGVPYLTSWWSRGAESWFNLTNGLVAVGALERNPWPHYEHALGLGPITYGTAFAGLFALRRRRLVLVLLGAALTLFVCMSSVAPGASLWRYLYPYVPGGAAMRALGRVSLLLLIPLALCAAWAVKELAARRPALAAALVALCVLEQARTQAGYDKEEARRDVARLAEQVPPGTHFFLVAPTSPLESEEAVYHLHLDALWASLATGVPTVNGYSGRVPPGWDFDDHMLDGPLGEGDVVGAVREWFARPLSVEVRAAGAGLRVHLFKDG